MISAANTRANSRTERRPPRKTKGVVPDQCAIQDPAKMYADRKPDEAYLPGAGLDEQLCTCLRRTRTPSALPA